MLLLGGPFVNGKACRRCGRALRGRPEAVPHAQLVGFCALWQSLAHSSPPGPAVISLRSRHVTGTGGNPGGRPKELKHVQELARQYTNEAIETLADIMRNSNEPARARAAAAEALLDRGWGKARQQLEGNVKHKHAWTEIPASLRERIAAAFGMIEYELQAEEERARNRLN
jgi:hypothetical protein